MSDAYSQLQQAGVDTVNVQSSFGAKAVWGALAWTGGNG
jgi:hypothetical protein